MVCLDFRTLSDCFVKMDERKAGSWIEFGKILFFAKLTKRLLGGARINFNEGQGVV